MKAEQKVYLTLPASAKLSIDQVGLNFPHSPSPPTTWLFAHSGYLAASPSSPLPYYCILTGPFYRIRWCDAFLLLA